jgi:hypothetical protein
MAPHGDAMHGSSGLAATHDGMDMGGSGSDSSMMMMSIFQNSMATPLYSQAWTPTTIGAYAGTCIFLIVLGALMRGLLAAKAIQEARWLDRELERRYVKVQGQQGLGAQISQDSLGKKMVLSQQGLEQDVVVVEKKRGITRPWRLSVDPLRAVIDTVIAGVGYLL